MPRVAPADQWSDELAKLQRTVAILQTAVIDLQEQHLADRLARLEAGAAATSRRSTESLKAKQRSLQLNGHERRSSIQRMLTELAEDLAVARKENECLSKDLDNEKQKTEQKQEISIALMLLLSYADLFSDVYLAVINLHGSHPGFAYASFAAIGLSLLSQAFVTKTLNKVAWFSKEVLCALLGLGPVLAAYRCVFMKPELHEKASRSSLDYVFLLGFLKSIEVLFESVPETVLQLGLLAADPKGWNSPALLVSLCFSIIASAILTTDAEESMNSGIDSRTRQMYISYFDYLPLQGMRRRAILLLLMIFETCYLSMFASAIAALGTINSTAAGFLVAGLVTAHHLLLVGDGSWPRCPGENVWNVMVNTMVCLCAHSCPLMGMRDPNWSGGPHHFCRLIGTSFLVATAVSAFVLLGGDDGAYAASISLVRCVCLPCTCIALAAGAGFLSAVQNRFRWTFYRRETMAQMHRRIWGGCPEDAEGDELRMYYLRRNKEIAEAFFAGAVCEWVSRRKPIWKETRPKWYTDGWFDGLPGTLTADGCPSDTVEVLREAEAGSRRINSCHSFRVRVESISA